MLAENQKVISAQKGAVLRLTINNAPANTLSIETMTALKAAIDEAGADDSAHVAVLGHVGKVFSAGHDLREMTARRGDADGGAAFFEQTFSLCAALMLAIVQCPKPVIAVVNGLAIAKAYDYAAQVMTQNMAELDACAGIGAFMEKNFIQNQHGVSSQIEP